MVNVVKVVDLADQVANDVVAIRLGDGSVAIGLHEAVVAVGKGHYASAHGVLAWLLARQRTSSEAQVSP